jgi:hypothetical protein
MDDLEQAGYVHGGVISTEHQHDSVTHEIRLYHEYSSPFVRYGNGSSARRKYGLI